MNQVRKCSPGLISNIWRLSARKLGIVSADEGCNSETKLSWALLHQLRERLFPPSEDDPDYRAYLDRLSLSGLQTLGLTEVAAAVLIQVGHMAAGPQPDHPGGVLPQMAAIVLIGILTLAAAHTRLGREHPRAAAALSAWAAPAALLWSSRWSPPRYSGADHYILVAITVVVIVAVSAAPLRPWSALALGISVMGVYIFFEEAGTWLAAQVAGTESAAHIVFLAALAILATGVAAGNYRRRAAEYAAGQEAVRVAEALSGAQLRAQLAENAVSIGKMAAALSHELNSPLGTLRSSIETLLALTERPADPETQRKHAEARAALCRSIRDSAERVDEVVARLRRFVSLEEAELKSADLNDLLADVALLHQDEIQRRGIRLYFDLEQLPLLDCRPQLLSAAFSALLSNAIRAVDGEGQVRISTRRSDTQLEVTIQDNGHGISTEEADTIFDPSFKIDGGRVASGSWSLFNARQIVYEHGGEIRLETAAGQGTAVHVVLPLAQP